jgi:hypothetical protein
MTGQDTTDRSTDSTPTDRTAATADDAPEDASEDASGVRIVLYPT